MWAVELTNLAGVRRGDVEFVGAKLTRRLNGGMTLSFSADPNDDRSTEIAVGTRVAKLYDQELNALRFHGKIRDPLTRTPDAIAVTAGGPVALLDRRRRQSEFRRTAIDAGVIVDELLDEENLRSPTRLRMREPIPPSVLRDRVFEPGRAILEALTQLAEADDGFYFLEQPLDGVAGTYAELELRYPAAGVDQPDVKLEFGEGTLANLESYKITEGLPINAVTTVGAGSGVTGRLTGRREEAGSIAAYDLLETEIGYSNVTEQATLDQLAQEGLQPAPRKTYSVAPLPAGGAEVNGVYVPRLFRDFDVGDTIRIAIKDGATQEADVVVRVTEATIAIADNDAGSEDLSSLTLELA